ncbi:hypothetical protein BDF20DRAFT_617873 [Mycotypha africana]|uniref:uncharacterized protein n=1 Tax=Mycotypha africana TaxID=64632 RepID=UPI00230113E3|nr:uncharacterized protein BDF20DRAFT_617873 [Mycotypha africana]KAI8975605.1 hypothetical protein BDF20DRAFT_617873 [Mycotypha africana]
MEQAAFAEHILKNIRAELDLLKRYNYIQPQSYNDILKLLPNGVDSKANGMPSSSPYPRNNTSAGVMPVPSSDTKDGGDTAPPSYQSAAKELGSVEALYDYKGSDPNTDLTFCRGDIIQLQEMVNDDWWKGTLYGRTGIFPRNYVKRIEGHSSEKKSPAPPPTPARNNSKGNYPSPPSNQYHSPYPPPAQSPPYAAPPPSAQFSTYAPPPPQQQMSYAPPPPQQQMTYAPPPVQHVMASGPSSAPAVATEQHEENKVSSFGKKLAGNVANAATWGFGATIGSDIANSIF